jgi:hypothetical protein
LADARAVGLSERVVRGSRFRRIFRGVYIRADVLDMSQLRFDAAVRLATGDIWATCHTAAAFYAVPVPEDDDTHVGLPPGFTRPRCEGLAPHRHDTQPAIRIVGGRRVATPDDMFLQMAEYLDLVDLVILGDRLARVGLSSPEQLVEASCGHGGRGARLARRAAALVRARVDSPMETRVRLLIVLGGLPEPETGRAALDSCGGWIATPDLSYPAFKIAHEYDGADHTKPRQRHKDNRRRESYDREGWRLVLITGIDFFRFPAHTSIPAIAERPLPDVPLDAEGPEPAFRPGTAGGKGVLRRCDARAPR